MLPNLKECHPFLNLLNFCACFFELFPQLTPTGIQNQHPLRWLQAPGTLRSPVSSLRRRGPTPSHSDKAGLWWDLGVRFKSSQVILQGPGKQCIPDEQLDSLLFENVTNILKKNKVSLH